jgi:acetyltransferase-like isoleucine patch superfamily enzyme
MNLVKRVFDEEGRVPALRRLGSTVLSRTVGRLNAATFGWTHAVVPPGSIIVGTKSISVEPGFFAHGPVWIEAVTSYGDQSFSPSITIGRDFRASDGVHLSAVGRVTIGDDCLFGSGVLITDNSHGRYGNGDTDADHPLSAPAERNLTSRGDIVIGDSCWLGENVVVLSGVEIGSGSVVSANSVVTRSLPPHCIAAGSPARVLKLYDETSGTWRPADRDETANHADVSASTTS